MGSESSRANHDARAGAGSHGGGRGDQPWAVLRSQPIFCSMCGVAWTCHFWGRSHIWAGWVSDVDSEASIHRVAVQPKSNFYASPHHNTLHRKHIYSVGNVAHFSSRFDDSPTLLASLLKALGRVLPAASQRINPPTLCDDPSPGTTTYKAIWIIASGAASSHGRKT